MNNYGEHKPAGDHVEIALEESCGALMMLESIRARADRTVALSSVQADIEQAIHALRQVIDELRMERAEAMSPIALGFVTASRGDE